MHNIDWLTIFTNAVLSAEKHIGLSLIIHEYVVEEVKHYINRTAKNLNTPPNVAKAAGLVAFWLRKLKPVSHHPDSENTNTCINEYIAIHTGLGICKGYFDDTSKETAWTYDKRIVTDWVKSLRYNSHSPHGSMILFELIGSTVVTNNTPLPPPLQPPQIAHEAFRADAGDLL